MVSLQSAKCPECGANIEVNESLQNTICQYCGTTILVNDAIEKYKLELVGNVKIAGIKNRDDFLTQAKKHFKVEEYLEAKECLNEIIKEDCFDIEAYCELVKNDLALLKKSDFNLKISNCNDKYDSIANNYYEEFKEVYERLQKIDDGNTRNTFLSGFESDLEHITNAMKEVEDRKEKNEGIIDRLNEDYEKIKEYGYYDEYKNVMHDTFKCSKNIVNVNYSAVKGCIDSYNLIDYADLTVDGIIFGNYQKTSYNYNSNKDRVTIYTTASIPTESFEEIDERFENYKQRIDEVINNSKEKREKQDKKDEKYRKRHYGLNVFSLILCTMVLLTVLVFHIYAFITEGISFIIVLAIVIDSWFIRILFNWFENALDNVGRYKKKIQKNSL